MTQTTPTPVQSRGTVSHRDNASSNTVGVQNLKTVTSSSNRSPGTYTPSIKSSEDKKANSNRNVTKPDRRMSKREIRLQMKNAGVSSASNKRSQQSMANEGQGDSLLDFVGR